MEMAYLLIQCDMGAEVDIIKKLTKININNDKIVNILQGIREGFYTSDEISKWLRGEDIHEFKRE